MFLHGGMNRNITTFVPHITINNSVLHYCFSIIVKMFFNVNKQNLCYQLPQVCVCVCVLETEESH